jgi:predicted MFS family arabinose efflux permease
MMIVGAIFSFAAALVAARALAHYGPRRVVRTAFILSCIAFLLEFAASWISKRTLAVVVYMHMALFGATVISLFWSLINERFDPHAAKRAVSRIASGGTLGGVIGGAIGWNIASLTSVRGMLVVLAILNMIALSMIERMQPGRPSVPMPAPSRPPPPDSVGHGVRILRGERYLLTLGVMVAIVATVEALLDYTMAAHAREQLHDGRRLMLFFSGFHTIVAVFTFGAQALLSRRALERFGLAGTIAGLPIVLVILSALAIQSPGLLSVAVLRGGEAVLGNSLWRSAYELLYTPVAQEKKRPMKTVIDVGADRLGTLLGAAIVLAILAAAAPRASLRAIVIGRALIAVFVAQSLQRGYVHALEDSLRTGTVRVEATDVFDATTRRTLDLSARPSPMVPADPVAVEAPAPSMRGKDPLLAAVHDLVSGERLRVQRVLCTGEDDPRLTAFVIPLLARKDVRGEALAWLRRLGPRITGQLVDALTDRQLDASARRRITRVLRGLRSQPAVEGLVQGLSDERFDVRYDCGLALARMLERDSQLTVPAQPVLDAVRSELAIERRILDAEPHLDPLDDDADAPIFESVLRDRASRGLEHVFTILSLMLDRDPLRMAFRALTAGDEVLRGTALEYLENVLPAEIRDALWPYVTGRRRPARATQRSAQEVLKDLLEREGITRAIHSLTRRTSNA